MHVLFVHKNYPAQFGHIAAYLVEHEGFQCTFVSEREPGVTQGVRRIQYTFRGGATKQTHYCSRSFENFTWHSHAVYETMKAHPEVQPDLVVGHSGFGSTLFLADLYDCPIVSYFEWFYHTRNSEMDFRPELPSKELNILRTRTRNAMLLADLQTCTAGYSPTEWQRSQFPSEYQHKLETIFDGIDTDFWRPIERIRSGARRIQEREIPADVKIVTYVSRGFESARGFDIFMKVAKRLCDQRKDVVFVCVGSDRVCYGGDEHWIDADSVREHVLAQDEYDLSRFIFTGQVPPHELVEILNLSDLHIYLTVPFVLSWSMMDALACGCTVLASGTAPVQEMIEHGRNGLLVDFHDVDGFVRLANEVLDDPVAYRPLGDAGVEMIQSQYSLTKTLPKMLDLYHRVVAKGTLDLASARRSRPVDVARQSPKTEATKQVYKTRCPNKKSDLRLLFAIPHYCKATEDGEHGSVWQDVRPRVAGLRDGIVSLHQLFGKSQEYLHIEQRQVIPANTCCTTNVDVVICTTGDDHGVDHVELPPSLFEHCSCNCEPMLLGFECHAALQERLGDYDYYCYLEDDLVLHDPWFFDKLQWFDRQTSGDGLLQPNRYEVSRRPNVRKLYLDGDMPERTTAFYTPVEFCSADRFNSAALEDVHCLV